MTVTYDPQRPRYYDESDVRAELTRVYDLCHGCRLCFNLCPSFPSMFDAIDRHDGAVDALTVAEQDKVVDECYGCKLCYVKCPYIPPHEWQLDFPRLMLRAVAVRKRTRAQPASARLADQILGRTDLFGRLNTAAAPLVNAATGTPGSVTRRVMERAVGLASQRVLPPYARQRFSTWFKRRRPTTPATAGAPAPGRQGTVAIFPTCFVEYNEPAIGQDLVKVYERNGLACELPDGVRCCGARAGCAWPYLGGPDAELVAGHTFDACEYLVNLHRGEATSLDTQFGGDVPESVAYHVSCHLQAQNIGLRSRDLIKLTGTRIVLINKCSGIDGTWGLRASNYELAKQVAAPLAAAVQAAAGAGPVTKLTLADIADLRAYEREREAVRDHIIGLKRRRRVGVGPFITLVFENRDTVRFQIQEMARAERMLTDEAIEGELAAYNPLIPEPGQLSATMFVELTSAEEVRRWLPRLVGVERFVQLHLDAAGGGRTVIDAEPEATQASQLTREDTTASVHYIRFVLNAAEVEGFAAGPVRLTVDHPAYRHETELPAARREELVTDLRGP